MSKATGTKWMQKAVKRPGALTAKAKRAGMSVQAFAQKHKHDSGVTGEEARFAVTAKKVAKKRKGAPFCIQICINQVRLGTQRRAVGPW
jgi:hypothetical protein